jgi:urea transport system substrate-binding protein
MLFLLLLLLLVLPAQARPVKVGVLFSQSGTMAASEKPLEEATLLAISLINAAGGLALGNESRVLLEPVVANGASNPGEFARQVRQLRSQGVEIIFGCWTSDSRKAVIGELEKLGGLLFYPVQFEGQELSKHVVYSGISANQQLYPALDFLLQKSGKEIFLIGSDYVYPRTTNVLARMYLHKRGGQVAGEAYRSRGSHDFRDLVTQIKKSKCKAILNTINGDSQKAFFEELRRQGLKQPVMCLSLSESQAAELGPLVAHHYATWGYFMDLDNMANRRFRRRFWDKHGPGRILDDPTETAFWQVFAYAESVARVQDTRPQAIRQGLRALIVDTPGGLVRYDPKNLYCWRTVRIAQADLRGHMRVVWSSELPVKPLPFPLEPDSE